MSYKSVIRYFSHLVEKYHKNTLFFFLEDITQPGVTEELVSYVTDTVDVIDISEGTGERKDAVKYFRNLIRNSPYAELEDESVEKYLPKNRSIFKSYDVHKAFDKWSWDVLQIRAYSSYRKFCKVEIVDKKEEEAYDKLQNMVGLAEVKKLTDQVIASYKMQSIRKDYGFKNCPISRHMVFTGNPGSIKTSVARLLADILTTEGVLKSGALIECGRADLVGKYVGWTAQEVRSKFRAAEGGILFIDEAYALVDDSKSYGDEAINSIVQEMENRRDSVIVIFADYPDKTRDFL